MSSVAYLWADLSTRFPFHWVIVTGLLVHALVVLTGSGGNVLFMFRYFLVWLLIFSTAAVWAFFEGNVLVAPFGILYQTSENTRRLVLAGTWSLCGSVIGWHLAMLRLPYGAESPALSDVLHKCRRRLFSGGVLLASAFAALYVVKAGGFIGEGAVYATNIADFGFEFGVFNIFHFTGVALLLLSGLSGFQVSPFVIWFAIATLLPGVLTGSRADFLPQMFVLLLVLANRHIRGVVAHAGFARWVGYSAGVTALLLFGYTLALVIAFWREGRGWSQAAFEMLREGKGLLINEIYGHPMLYLETGNMVLGGLYSVIVNISAGWDSYLYGRSYLNYLLMSPPAFLGLPRPLGLEWSMSIGDERMALGGVFEVAEAYYNFGLVGCLGVSFLISYIFGRVLTYGLTRANLLVLTWYLVAGLMSFRAIWYQNFGYFRIATVMLLFYVVSLFFFRWFSKSHDAKLANRRGMLRAAVQ